MCIRLVFLVINTLIVKYTAGLNLYWMQFFVPKGAADDDIIVEYKHEGVPRNLASHKVEGSIRYRLGDSYKLNKVGKWTITIKKGLTVLKAFDVKVIDK